jgi:SHS2 domain-containing protein
MTDVRVRGHRLLEHTADIGVEAWGADLREAFAEAALALFELMVDVTTIEERAERRFSIAASDLEDLLVAWLSELIAGVDSDGMLFRRFEIDSLDVTGLEARGWGERIDPRRHRLRGAVKAATYHAIRVSPGPPASVRVILDL